LPPHFAALLLCVSGAAALIYEILWAKQLGLVVGVDAYGLVLGSVGLGRVAEFSSRPMRLFVVLEAVIGVVGVGATLALAQSPPLFVALEERVGPFAYALPFAIVAPPAFLTGGTLPALVRAVQGGQETVARSPGLLYAANTAGAVAGTVAVPFLLVPALGIRGTAIAAAALDLLACGLALVAGRLEPLLVSAAQNPQPLSADARVAGGLYALAGGIALGYEVVWSQAIVALLSTRAFAFAVVLATYLSGLALGSWLYAGFADHVRRPWAIFGLLIASAGAFALAAVACLGSWLEQLQSAAGTAFFGLTGSATLGMVGRFAVVSALIVLPPTIFLGAAFPAALRPAARASRIGGDVGTVIALNTAGGIAGTFLTGFALVPMLGLVRTLGALASVAALLGCVCVFREAPRHRPSVAAVLALMGVTLATGLLVADDHLARLLVERRGGRLVTYRESPGGTVAVLEQRTSRDVFRRLYIDGVSNSGDATASLRYMRLQALLPLLLHSEEPRSALVVGLGTGITAGALLADPARLLPPRVRLGSAIAPDPMDRPYPRIRTPQTRCKRSPALLEGIITGWPVRIAVQSKATGDAATMREASPALASPGPRYGREEIARVH
jgi:predicted membrane-bound spermidine synthase